MFKLTPELAQKSSNNDPFWAVRCGNGMMVISGSAGSMEVPSEGIRLGQRFFNTPQNVIVREGEMDAYRESRRLALIESVKPTKASSAKIISYSQLNKKKNQRKRK